ncbi:hypothetical protein PI125_g25265 [Phytophthora idaei]|nr:hypothetical protein PI125_g25265 [Phytophthora idaei]
MATLTAHSPSAFAGHQNQHNLQSRPPVYNIGLRDSFERRSSIGDNQDVYIGEGLIDPDGVDDINQFGEDEGVAQKPHQHRRRILDYLAIDVGEKYLDDIYKEDDSDTSDGEESGFYSDGPRSSLHQYHLTSRQAAVVKPLDVDLVQLDQIEEEQASHQRPQKEMAWKKVRRLLVEEEEKAAIRKKPVAPTREAGNADYDTVKLLDILARSGTEDFIKTEPQIPVVEYTAVSGATGANEQLAAPAGINRFVFSQKESLGIVCYFPNLETLEETKVKEFSWTAQLKHHMLNKMREIGIDLENIVYFRGEMHYLVMTPKRNNLLVRGVVKQNHPNSKDLVRDDNINQSVLHAFVKRIIDFAGIPRRTDFTRVSLFDFTSLTRAEKAASVISSHGKKLYIGLVGDSLLEPVWHEGVGTCRGFLSALDGAWMIAQIGRKSDEQLLADRELAYQVMRRLSGHHRDEMQKNVRKYTVDPRSRYMIDFPRVV